MSKQRPNSLQQRFGFCDLELTTPKHDEIVLWVQDNAFEIFGKFLEKKPPENCSVECIWEPSIGCGSRMGFVDLSVRILNDVFFVEAKSEIKSLGELFRQLSLYKSMILGTGGRIVVVCPVSKHRKIIEDQGYIFVEAFDPKIERRGGVTND